MKQMALTLGEALIAVLKDPPKKATLSSPPFWVELLTSAEKQFLYSSWREVHFLNNQPRLPLSKVCKSPSTGRPR